MESSVYVIFHALNMIMMKKVKIYFKMADHPRWLPLHHHFTIYFTVSTLFILDARNPGYWYMRKCLAI